MHHHLYSARHASTLPCKAFSLSRLVFRLSQKLSANTYRYSRWHHPPHWLITQHGWLQPAGSLTLRRLCRPSFPAVPPPSSAPPRSWTSPWSACPPSAKIWGSLPLRPLPPDPVRDLPHQAPDVDRRKSFSSRESLHHRQSPASESKVREWPGSEHATISRHLGRGAGRKLSLSPSIASLRYGFLYIAFSRIRAERAARRGHCGGASNAVHLSSIVRKDGSPLYTNFLYRLSQRIKSGSFDDKDSGF